MQPVSTALYNALENVTLENPRDLTWLFELYEPDVLPGADGFDPADASQRFAMIEITWLGLAYRRIVLSASDIQVRSGREANTCSLTLSNADENRYAANWVNSTQVEGMRLVVRLISRSASAALTDSAVRFVGRCQKPDGFDVIRGTIQAGTSIANGDYEWPPRVFQADDPEGRSPADPLYEGFPFVTISGSFAFRRSEPDKNYARGDIRRYVATQPWSSYDDTPLGDPLPWIGGRTQMRLNRGLYVDTGRVTNCLDFICMGPIAGVLNFRMDMDEDYRRYFAQPQDVTVHLGEAGGTGTQTADPIWPNHPLFSFTAYVTYHHVYIGTGAFTNIDAGQPTVMIVMGAVIALPNGSGVFDATGWSDNGAYLTRHLLTDSRFLNNNPAFVEDSACWATGLYNDAPIVDDSNAETIPIPNPDLDEAGSGFLRYRSTGLIDVNRARYDLGLDVIRPEERDVIDFEGYDFDAPPALIADVRRLRKRFTTNVLLRKKVKGLDFLYNTVLSSFRGLIVWNWRGKIEPRSERPADFTHLRTAVSSGVAVAVEDVTPWKAAGGLWGKAVLGAGLTTSEARKVASADYTADANSITLAAQATGTVTATPSGATLSGGSSSTQATGTVTIGGTAQGGAQVSATIQGVQVAHTLSATDTLATAAYMLAQHINANTQLRRFVSAEASGAVVTVRAKWGILTLASALVNSHAGPVANPTTAPVGLSASGSGSSLLAGTYRVAYANRTALGSTYLSPYATVTVTAGQQIDIPALALPGGVTSRDWFVSKAAGDTEMVLHTNATGSGFAITAPPSPTAAFPPEYNATGAELVRVALSFASNNQTPAILAQANLTRGNIFEGTYKWPLSGQHPSYTQVIGNYIDSADDFATAKIELNDKARRARLGKDSPREIDLTAVDNWPQARRLTYYDFSKYLDHHWFNTFRSNGLALLLEELDVVCGSDDSGGHVNVLTRVEDFTVHLADFTVTVSKARLYSSKMFLELVPKTQPLLPSVLRWVKTLDTVWEFIDLPAVASGDAGRAAFYVVATFDLSAPGDWKGWTLWADFGAGYQQIGDGDTIGTLGTVSGTLAAGDPNTYYPAATLTVVLKNGDPGGTLTQADLEADPRAHLAVYGDEYLQYAAAVETDPATHTWTLTGLYRGRLGTLAAAHGAGERFALMDARSLVELPPSLVGVPGDFKMLTVNQSLGDVTAVSRTWTGGTLKYAAAGMQATLDASTGDWRFRLFGRVTTDPEAELYKLTIVGGRTFNLRGDESRPVSLSTASVLPSDEVPPPGKGNYHAADVPGNSVTNSAAYVAQLIRGERAAISATYFTDLTAADSPASNEAVISFSSGMLQSLTMTIDAQTSTASPSLIINDNLLGTVFTDTAGEATGTRYTVEFSDGKVKFFRNRHSGSAPFYVHTPPNYEVEYPSEEGDVMFPSEAHFSAGTDTTWADIELDDAGAAVLYTAAEQEGDGFVLPLTSVTVRASQQRVVEGVTIDGVITEVEFP